MNRSSPERLQQQRTAISPALPGVGCVGGLSGELESVRSTKCKEQRVTREARTARRHARCVVPRGRGQARSEVAQVRLRQMAPDRGLVFL